MNGTQYALRQVHAAEQRLLAELCQLAGAHRDDHEIHHVARDLAAWSEEHTRLLAQQAAAAGTDVAAVAPDGGGAVTPADPPPSGPLRLLGDLQEVYLRAARASLGWEMLAQLAQAKRNAELLDLAGRCHARTLRQIRWVNTMIKTQSPQALASLGG